MHRALAIAPRDGGVIKIPTVFHPAAVLAMLVSERERGVAPAEMSFRQQPPEGNDGAQETNLCPSPSALS